MLNGQGSRSFCRKWFLYLFVPSFILAWIVTKDELNRTTFVELGEVLRDLNPLNTSYIPEEDNLPRSLGQNETTLDIANPVLRWGGDEGINSRVPRLLCWILTDRSLAKKTKPVRDTWTRRCDVTLFMSSEEDLTFPMVGLNVSNGRSHIASKAKAAWSYIYRHHFNDADFFMKADPDTFVVVENLKAYLKDRNASVPEFYGHRFKLPGKNYTYTSGGPGHVLSREALRRLVTQAFLQLPNCIYDGEGEDYKTGRCLTNVGARLVDTRDIDGRETFLVFHPKHLLSGDVPAWYKRYDQNGVLTVYQFYDKHSTSAER